MRQNEPLGLGHAVYKAKSHAGGEVCAVLLGDDIITADKPCLKQIMDIYERYGASVIAVQRVEQKYLSRYGVVEAECVDERIYRIKRVVEKPRIDDAPSDLAIMGRYILTPAIFECIEKTPPGKNGEMQLTDTLNILLEKEEIYGYEFEGKRYDLGDKFDWLRINVELALQREDFREKMEKMLDDIAKHRI